jgi:hypothetical protein
MGAGFVQAGGNVIYADGYLSIWMTDWIPFHVVLRFTYRTSMLEIPLA